MAPPRRRLVGLSTKMYFSLAKTKDFTDAFIEEMKSADSTVLSSVDIFVIPDFITITNTGEQLKSAPVPVWLGAQDTHWEDSGAFTGERSEEHTSELQSQSNLVCRLLLEKKNILLLYT